MSLLFKDDWEETKERYRAWWAGGAIGRCALAVRAPRRKPLPAVEPVRPATPEERWKNLDYIGELSDWENSRTFFGGEAFPVWGYGYPGNKSLGAFLGCPVKLDFETGWLDPVLTGEGIDWRSLRLDESNRWWRFTLDWLRRAAEASRGKCIPMVGAFGGSGDTLAWVRGTDRLLLDVADRPDEVRAADMHLMDLWCRVYDVFHGITKESAEGSTCWFNLWSPGKFYAAQNDFSYMISPRMFRDIFLPAVSKQAGFLDHSVYHVDGVAAFAHVDALCELPGLQAIQILPGAGRPSPLHYMDALRRVQAAGKRLHISIEAGEVREALRQLSADGLYISTWCASEDEARDLLRKAEKWSRSPRVRAA